MLTRDDIARIVEAEIRDYLSIEVIPVGVKHRVKIAIKYRGRLVDQAEIALPDIEGYQRDR